MTSRVTASSDPRCGACGKNATNHCATCGKAVCARSACFQDPAAHGTPTQCATHFNALIGIKIPFVTKWWNDAAARKEHSALIAGMAVWADRLSSYPGCVATAYEKERRAIPTLDEVLRSDPGHKQEYEAILALGRRTLTRLLNAAFSSKKALGSMDDVAVSDAEAALKRYINMVIGDALAIYAAASPVATTSYSSYDTGYDPEYEGGQGWDTSDDFTLEGMRSAGLTRTAAAARIGNAVQGQTTWKDKSAIMNDLAYAMASVAYPEVEPPTDPKKEKSAAKKAERAANQQDNLRMQLWTQFSTLSDKLSEGARTPGMSESELSRIAKTVTSFSGNVVTLMVSDASDKPPAGDSSKKSKKDKKTKTSRFPSRKKKTRSNAKVQGKKMHGNMGGKKGW